jgi:hypothetical protein
MLMKNRNRLITMLVATAIILLQMQFVLAPAIDMSPQTTSPEIVITLDRGQMMGTNSMSLGFMLDNEWPGYVSRSARQDLAREANFAGLIRVFDYRSGNPNPCIHWNESGKVGTFDWAGVDLLVQTIYATGAEPMFVLGGYSGSGGPRIPSGMAVNPVTNLPYPDSFASYASEWVRHFKASQFPVRYYEIVNEPWAYFGWEHVDFAKLGNYMQLFNAVTSSMRRENSDLMISQDFIGSKQVLDYWLTHGGADVDSINIHKYGASIVGQRTDAEMFQFAEKEYFGTWPLGQSIEEARQAWFRARGKLLPMIISEYNFNSASAQGTDPKIQQMAGAVWTALVLRMSVLAGVRQAVYYSYSGSASWGMKNTYTGAGFGMVNGDNDYPWYQYYVHYMLGNNLGVGDAIVGTTSSSEDVRALAWIHNEKLNILLICKVDEPRIVRIEGLEGELKLLRIDNSIPWQTPAMQTNGIKSEEPLVINGYTVALLEGQVPLLVQRRT